MFEIKTLQVVGLAVPGFLGIITFKAALARGVRIVENLYLRGWEGRGSNISEINSVQEGRTQNYGNSLPSSVGVRGTRFVENVCLQ